MKTQDVIGQLLASLGSPQEVAQYLRVYAQADSPALGVIKVGGPLLDEKLDSLVAALLFLREVGLRPVLVHGAGPQLDRALAKEGLPTTFEGDQRVTDAPTLDIARRVFQRVNLEFVEALNASGIPARPVVSSVVTAHQTENPRLGFVGDRIEIDPAPLLSSLRAGQIPVLPPLGESPSGQILNVNTDAVVEAMSLTLRPHKILFLTKTGGLLDRRGNVLSAVNLLEDGQRLLKKPWVKGGMRYKLERIWRMLENLGPDASVSITAPENLARELFTHQGAGTLVRLGEVIRRLPSFDDVDKERVSDLMLRCFGRSLVPDYFDTKRPQAVYLAESYRGAAIITDDLGPDIAYLDKFGVTDRAQGAGVGASLWHRLSAENPRLVWRSRAHNPINGWYLRKSDGAIHRDGWVCFWKGISPEEAGPLVEKSFELPATLLSQEEEDARQKAAPEAARPAVVDVAELSGPRLSVVRKSA